MKKTIGIILATVCVCFIIGVSVYFAGFVNTALVFGSSISICWLVVLICWLLDGEDND